MQWPRFHPDAECCAYQRVNGPADSYTAASPPVVIRIPEIAQSVREQLLVFHLAQLHRIPVETLERVIQDVKLEDRILRYAE